MTTTGSRLAGKVAIVTGGASGFGAAIALRFAQEGAHVVIGDINTPGMAHTSSQHPTHITHQQMDVTSLRDWHSIVRHTVETHGHIDILVNNAGTTYRNKASTEVTLEEFQRVFDVNVKSVFWASKTFIPQLLEQGRGGSMINISSTGAQRPRPGLVWYNSSKGAVSNATKGLAAEYGPQQIRVNNVCPLLSGTGLFEMFVGVPDTPENRAKFVSNVPLGRLTDPNDVANMCVYLASDEAAFINGTDLVVDGGKCI
ncbi:hypothetical protein PRK78_001613 [Emydomyces testavorans]|uniref:Oxidoreductase n=1 Tax=Emydomyces testavorans TaxID=2070801 RepID=A0AAF0DCT0_9EURO|nr:hypothetical protein PRK78_001613 [Emydomyces testavorans]